MHKKADEREGLPVLSLENPWGAAAEDSSTEPALAFTRIERDICELIRQSAQLRFDLTETQRKSKDQIRKILLELVAVMDAFERVFNNIAARQDALDKQMAKWVSNFRTVCRLLGRLLEDQGVRRMENLAEGFDPRWHRVAETIADPAKEDGTIVEETVRGYVWNTEILRKAEVIVVNNGGESLPEETKDEAASDT